MAMAHEFPKEGFYSNENIKLNKNLLKGLNRVKEENQEIDDRLLGIRNRCEPLFGKLDSNRQYKHLRRKLSENIKTLCSNSQKNYPEDNFFKKIVKSGFCESCKKRRRLDQAHIIKKAAFKRPYNRWFFLKYHPANILFLCSDCHAKFDSRYKNNFGQTLALSKSQLNRIEKVLRKRVREIHKAVKADEKYLRDYERKIDLFNDKMRKLLKDLLKHL